MFAEAGLLDIAFDIVVGLGLIVNKTVLFTLRA